MTVRFQDEQVRLRQRKNNDRHKEMQEMAYQSGIVEQKYTQDNSGDSDDITKTVTYTPQQFGAPANARLVENTVLVSPYVLRGNAWISDQNIQDGTTIVFVVHTEAAGGFPFGHHSSAIEVQTAFQWYVD